MSLGALWTNRREIGANASQTGAPRRGNVIAVGGGFYPTLSLGGGAGDLGGSRRGLELGS